MKDTAHFKRAEFLCPCCKKEKMQQGIVDFLERLSGRVAQILGKRIPIIINSGYRCPKHSVAVGGYAADAHVHGWAVDIRCSNTAVRFAIISAAILLGCVRIGIAKTFIHLDLDPSLYQRHTWVY